MKRISKSMAIAGTMIAAVALVSFTPTSQRTAQAGPIVDLLSGGYYGGYGPGYGAYSGYGYSPYGYRVSPGYVYPTYGGYGPAYRRGGYSYRSYGGSPYYGHAYAPYGGGVRYYGNGYSPYGYGGYSNYGY